MLHIQDGLLLSHRKPPLKDTMFPGGHRDGMEGSYPKGTQPDSGDHRTTWYLSGKKKKEKHRIEFTPQRETLRILGHTKSSGGKMQVKGWGPIRGSQLNREICICHSWSTRIISFLTRFFLLSFVFPHTHRNLYLWPVPEMSISKDNSQGYSFFPQIHWKLETEDPQGLCAQQCCGHCSRQGSKVVHSLSKKLETELGF